MTDNPLVFINGEHTEQLNQPHGPDYRALLTHAGVWNWLDTAEPGQTNHIDTDLFPNDPTDTRHHEITMLKTSPKQHDEIYII